MEGEYWLKCGLKKNGDLTCIRALLDSKPTEKFFYTEDEKPKEVKNPFVIKLTKEVLDCLGKGEKGIK